MKEGRKEGRKKEVMVERRAAIADTSSITYRSVIGFINHSLLTAFVGVLLSTRVFRGLVCRVDCRHPPFQNLPCRVQRTPWTPHLFWGPLLNRGDLRWKYM